MATSLVNNKYRITRRIGGGSFGEIYMGVGPNNEKVAVKFERHGTRCPQLRHEYKVYRELTGCHGFCQVYHFGQQDNYNVMVMDLLGPSLEDLFNKCNRRFSLKTVLQIADQMLERVDTLHSRHLIHRDIKPANFVIGLGENAANIYCVDFGLSKRYRHPKNLQHIPHRDGRSLTGTPRYASINNHLGIEQSRRDDLESIGYVLIYFLKGSLPWQGLKAKNAQKKYRLILEKKQQVSIAQLCQGCPSQFAEFLAYTRSLKFDAKPDIPYLRKLFRDLYHAQNCGSIPKLWDWDGMDNDYNSTSGSTGQPPVAAPAVGVSGAGGPQVPAGGMTSHLRPTTAAAVAAPGAMLGVDPDLGMAGMPDELDDPDYDPGVGGHMHGHRPTTAGGLMQSYGKPGPGVPGQGVPAQGSWGYPRQAGSGVPEDPNVARRPHTAHGARGGFPSAGVPVNGAAGVYMQDPKAAAMYASEGEDGHVVAGAREMMRYRRTRTNEGVGNGQPVAPMNPAVGGYAGVPPQGAAGGNWAVYQQATAKPSSAGVGLPSQAAQQQAALRKPVAGAPAVGASGANGNWSYGAAPAAGQMMDNRPKSATMTGTAGVGARPVSGSMGGPGMAMAPTVSNSAAVGGQWNPSNGQGVGMQSGMATNNNTLSYGSLKNRLMSGNSAQGSQAAGTPVSSNPSLKGGVAGGMSGAAAPTNGTGASATGTTKSKLFSLAR